MIDWEIAGIWFGLLLPGCYFLAHRLIDRRVSALDLDQKTRNELALWIGAPASVAIALLWAKLA